MGESIITRSYPGGSAAVISNQTKELLGLSNNATLDDALQTLAYKDDNYATIIVQVLNPDGSNSSDAKVRMLDYGGTNVVYNADDSGKCIFKTNQANANFYNDEIYEDINSQEIRLDTVIGSIKTITFTRQLYDSSYSKNITSNGNIQFSNLINNISVHVAGGGGGASSGTCSAECSFNLTGGTYSIESYSTNNIGYAGGNGFYNDAVIDITPLTDYNIIIGSKGVGGRSNYTSSLNKGSSSFVSVDSSCYRVNGNSGGTTSFGGIISAVGGGGGLINQNSNIGGNNNILGGKYGWLAIPSVSPSCTSSKYSNGTNGSNGFVIISNFHYK